MDLVKRMSHDLGLVNHKGLNGTGKVTSHDFHRVNQSTHAGTKNATILVTNLGVASHIASCP